MWACSLGLKPQAESYSPFGAKMITPGQSPMVSHGTVPPTKRKQEAIPLSLILLSVICHFFPTASLFLALGSIRSFGS